MDAFWQTTNFVSVAALYTKLNFSKITIHFKETLKKLMYKCYSLKTNYVTKLENCTPTKSQGATNKAQPHE